MNYMVFDLEFNQVFSFKNEHTRPANPICPFEIIHIGAVKLDEDFNEISTFDRLVKPKLYTRIHPIIKKITGITKSDLKTSKPFKLVYKELVSFIDDVGVLCVWGTSDIKELLRNIEYHKLDTSIIPGKYIDVQHYVSKHLMHPKGTTISLSSAVKSFNIPIDIKFHNAFNDAFYTAEVFKKFGNKKIKPDIYHLHNDNKSDIKVNKKTIFDMERLIKQFEKLFHRKMTSEEQNIIKLAYEMGNRNQFQR